jgi:predicted dehydrogenase
MLLPLDIRGRAAEEDKRIKAGFIGCGSHAFRNIYPTFQFAGVDLAATCDLNIDLAESFARQFGARRFYSSHMEMLENEELDAVFIVTNYDENGKPRYPRLAMDCMQAGCHVWTEKPPSASSAELEEALEVSRKTGKFTMVGFKKVYEITRKPEFGKPSTIVARYPQYIPSQDQKSGFKNNGALIGFLDHICHPLSIINYIMGRIESLYYERSMNGGGFALFKFESGATGSLHLAHGQSGTSPLERLEVVGEGSNVVLDNGIKLVYYRPGGLGARVLAGTALQQRAVYARVLWGS